MRVFMCAALLAACDTGAARPYAPPMSPGIAPGASTGDSTGEAPRLDLGTEPPSPDLPSGTGTTGEPGTTGAGESTADGSSGDAASTGGSTGDASTGDSSSGSTSTGEASTTSEGSSSTGEPPAATCGDGVCEASERAPCWGPKGSWCFEDCWQAPECKSDCPCTPEAAAAKNWCYADPLPACAPTAPGGYCSWPDGDVWGFYSWTSSCA